MLKWSLLAAAIALAPAPASADGLKSLTVREAVTVWQVLTDPSFKDFKFSGPTRMVFARYIAATFPVKQNADARMTENRTAIAGPGKDVPKEHLDEFLKQGEELLSADSGVQLPLLPLRDLCLDATPEACSVTPPVKNDISPAMLSGLLPLIRE